MKSHIWVIDDSNLARTVLTLVLQRDGFAVTCFPDGREALRQVESAEIAFPDLVLLDLVLPEMDGYEIARRLKQTRELTHTAIVMVSCRDGLFDYIKARLAGAAGYVTKPFDVSDVITLVRKLLERDSGTPPIWRMGGKI